MSINELPNDPELQRVLIACYEYWRSEALPPDQRTICYTWVVGTYRSMFGTEFHQTKLYLLTKLGFLTQDESSRGGGRRYYQFVNPDLVRLLVEKWKSPVA
jgi:hypothetical protein